MKLTWFAGTTIRIHIGGEILVADAGLAPAFVERSEIVSGADRLFALAENDPTVPLINSAAWRPRPAPRAIDEGSPQAVALRRIADRVVLVDAPGDPPLLLIAGTDVPRLGRWAAEAVLVLFGVSEGFVTTASTLLDVSPPRLIAIAAGEVQIDVAIAELSGHLNGTALVSLEPGMALEV